MQSNERPPRDMYSILLWSRVLRALRRTSRNISTEGAHPVTAVQERRAPQRKHVAHAKPHDSRAYTNLWGSVIVNPISPPVPGGHLHLA